MTLGYAWVDAFRPQSVAYVILNQFPVAAVMGTAAFVCYALMDRRSPPRLNLITTMQVLLAIWVTATTFWAVAPTEAWAKWDWAFKSLAFAAFVPFVIRSAVQIEAFIQVFVLALAANIVPYGLKIAISGGGYGRTLGLVGGNSGLSEGATLAAISVMTVPILLYLFKHAQLGLPVPWFRFIYLGMAATALLTTIGTYQRTGLVGLVVLGGVMVAKSRHKILMGFLSIIVGGVIAAIVTETWTSRISTIGTYEQDGSAMTRILVWRWTLEFVLSNPLGGGFEAYRINTLFHSPTPQNPTGFVEHGRAFHSVYFEVLGEHGWIGLALFMGLILFSLLSLQGAARRAKRVPGLEWCVDLVAALQAALVVVIVCGAFIGIAFQPVIHYLFALAVAVPQYVRKAIAALPPEQAPATNQVRRWRDRMIPSPRPWQVRPAPHQTMAALTQRRGR
jgi:probable O-glycosylation ligase (exosortase A-associated)